MERIERIFRTHPKRAPAVYVGIAWFVLAAAGSYLANRAVPGTVGTHAVLAALVTTAYAAGFIGGWGQRGPGAAEANGLIGRR